MDRKMRPNWCFHRPSHHFQKRVWVRTYTLLEAVAKLPTGGQVLFMNGDFHEFLMNRDREKTKEGREAKYAVVQAILDSEVKGLLAEDIVRKLEEYVAQGPHYVKTLQIDDRLLKFMKLFKRTRPPTFRGKCTPFSYHCNPALVLRGQDHFLAPKAIMPQGSDIALQLCIVKSLFARRAMEMPKLEKSGKVSRFLKRSRSAFNRHFHSENWYRSLMQA